MSILRIVLIILGIAFIAGVYFYTRRHPPSGHDKQSRAEPSLNPGIAGSPDAQASRSQPTAAEVGREWRPPALPDVPAVQLGAGSDVGESASEPAGREEIFSLALRLPDDGVPAQSLLRMLERLQLIPNEQQIYHRPGPEGESLFSAANLFEPGVLQPLGEDERLRGLVFFFQATPGADASMRFDRMLGAARECAQRFGGQVQDGAHRPLTAARELELKLAAAGAHSRS